MPRMTINTSEATSFEATQPGPYSMTIDELEGPIKSKEKQTPGLNVYFKFVDPDLDQKCGRVRRFYPITGKGAGFFADLYKTATGSELPIGKEGGDLDIDTDDLMGKQVTVDIDNREHEGKMYNEAKKVVAAH